MNERIKELAQEAYTYALIHDNSCHGEVYNKKFAELIVRECAEMMPQDNLYKMILKRFGVEE